MIKRTSLVWKRPGLSAAAFRDRWLGEHVAYAKQLPGLEQYVIDFITEGPEGSPAGIARSTLGEHLPDGVLDERVDVVRESDPGGDHGRAC